MNGKTYKVIQVQKTKTSVDHSKHAIGSVVQEDNKAYVYCQSGKVELIEIQAEGKKRMKVLDYLRGNKI